MLEVQDLVTDYGPVRAVDGVSLRVEAGKRHRGARRQRRRQDIAAAHDLGSRARERGRVSLGGEDITREPVEEIVRRGLAHVPEGRGVIGELTVEENLRLGGLWRGKQSGAARGDVRALPTALRAPQPAGRRRSPAASGRCFRSRAR